MPKFKEWLFWDGKISDLKKFFPYFPYEFKSKDFLLFEAEEKKNILPDKELQD